MKKYCLTVAFMFALSLISVAQKNFLKEADKFFELKEFFIVPESPKSINFKFYEEFACESKIL